MDTSIIMALLEMSQNVLICVDSGFYDGLDRFGYGNIFRSD